MKRKRFLTFIGLVCLLLSSIILVQAVAAQAPPIPPTCTVDSDGDGVLDTTHTATHFVYAGNLWVLEAGVYVNQGAYTGKMLGTAGNDVLILPSWPGIQKARGFKGHDVICGSDGPDILDGDMGNDIIYGGAGDDIVTANQENDIVYGEDGNDYLHGGTGDDFIWGGAGDDTLNAYIGHDTIYGEDGNDFIWAGTGDDDAWGGNGDDIIIGRPGVDNLYGEAGNDIIMAGISDDHLDGGADWDKCNLMRDDPVWIGGQPPTTDEHYNCEEYIDDNVEPPEPPTPLLTVLKTVMPAGGTCGIDNEDPLILPNANPTVVYCYQVESVVSAGSAAYDIVLIDDNGTPLNPADDFTVTLTPLEDLDNDADLGDLASDGSAFGQSDPITLALLNGQSLTNIAVAEAFANNGTPAMTSDTATVLVDVPLAITFSTFNAEGNALGTMLIIALGLSILSFGIWQLHERKL